MPTAPSAAVCVWRLPHQRTGGWVLGVVGTATAIVLALTFVLPVFSSARGFAVVALLAVAVPGSLIAIFADRRGPLWFGLGSALAIPARHPDPAGVVARLCCAQRGVKG